MTSKTTHTPGPWQCLSGSVVKGNIPIAIMDREPGNGTLPVERDCNARLIAAAPELLGALKAYLRAPSVGSDGPGSSTIVVQEYNRRNALAAIAKAEGRG